MDTRSYVERSPECQDSASTHSDDATSGGATPDTFDKLGRLLRLAGSLAFAAGVSVFLFQHWERGNDIHRYLLLLGQSLAITLAGLVCRHGFREAKSAATLVGLGLVTVPVQFTILGALLYSRFEWWPTRAPDFTGFARFADWTAPSGQAALGVAALAVTTLGILSAIAFDLLYKERARVLTGAFLLLNALLLIPTRDANVVASLLALGIALLVTLLRGALANPGHSRSGASDVGRTQRAGSPVGGTRVAGTQVAGTQVAEGHDAGSHRSGSPVDRLQGGGRALARGLLMAPLALLIGRSIGLYSISHYFQSVLCGGIAATLFYAPIELGLRNGPARVLRMLSLWVAGYGWWLFVVGLDRALGLPAGLFLPFVSLPFAGLLAWVSLHLPSSGPELRRAAGAITAIGSIANVLAVGGLMASLICATAGVILLVYGFFLQQRIVLLLGLVALVVGIGDQVRIAIHVYALSYSVSLALLGITTIVSAALLERHHVQLFAWFQRLQRELRAWES